MENLGIKESDSWKLTPKHDRSSQQISKQDPSV